jgi:hypothetical protein
VDHPVVAAAVRSELEPYLMEGGFCQVAEDTHSIVYESANTRVTAIWDPRGEIDVLVARLDEQSPHGRWQYGEITTAASVPTNLRQIIGEFTARPQILAGDGAFFDELRGRNEQRSRELTAYYSRKGPRPDWLGRERG